jgi:hypothetical protein
MEEYYLSRSVERGELFEALAVAAAPYKLIYDIAGRGSRVVYVRL